MADVVEEASAPLPTAGAPPGHYDALIAKWPTLVSTTTDAKLNEINTLKIAGPAVPAIVATYKIYDCILPNDFNSLPTTPNDQKQLVRDILALGTVDVSQASQARRQLNSFFTAAAFPTTRTNLTNLYALYDAPQILWWSAQTNPSDLVNGGGGLRSEVNHNDLDAAGLS
jgi:hypothetical protein